MTTQNTPVIAASKLTKRFGKVHALDGLNLTVNKGEVHGFLGPNGAGKSTTIRVLLGLLKKNGGEVKLFGEDPWKNSVELHKHLAYVPGDVNLWPNLSGGEVIDLLGALRGGLNKTRRNELIKSFKLDPRKKCGTYSKGNRQKVAIIAALASDVDLYIMDEPTSGLDPLMQSIFNSEVARLKKDGKTVLLSSHVLAEVETLCDRVTIIKDGKTVETDTLSELHSKAHSAVRVRTKNSITGLNKFASVQDLAINKNEATFKVQPADLDAVIKHLSKLTIVSLVCAPPTLEELFMRHYGSREDR